MSLIRRPKYAIAIDVFIGFILIAVGLILLRFSNSLLLKIEILGDNYYLQTWLVVLLFYLSYAVVGSMLSFFMEFVSQTESRSAVPTFLCVFCLGIYIFRQEILPLSFPPAHVLNKLFFVYICFIIGAWLGAKLGNKTRHFMVFHLTLKIRITILLVLMMIVFFFFLIRFWYLMEFSVETFRYLASSLIQVFGAVFVGNAIFSVFRNEIIERHRLSTREALINYINFLREEFGHINMDFIVSDDLLGWGEDDLWLDSNEQELWEEARKIQYMLSTPHLSELFGERVPDEEIGKVIAGRVTALNETEEKGRESKWFNSMTDSMYEYDRKLREVQGDFGEWRTKKIWNIWMVTLFVSPLLGVMVNTITLMMSDVNDTTGIKILALISVLLSTAAFITILFSYKSLLEDKGYEKPYFRTLTDSKHENKFKEWLTKKHRA